MALDSNQIFGIHSGLWSCLFRLQMRVEKRSPGHFSDSDSEDEGLIAVQLACNPIYSTPVKPPMHSLGSELKVSIVSESGHGLNQNFLCQKD